LDHSRDTAAYLANDSELVVDAAAGDVGG
jgi:hypothetical protein